MPTSPFSAPQTRGPALALGGAWVQSRAERRGRRARLGAPAAAQGSRLEMPSGAGGVAGRKPEQGQAGEQGDMGGLRLHPRRVRRTRTSSEGSVPWDPLPGPPEGHLPRDPAQTPASRVLTPTTEEHPDRKPRDQTCLLLPTLHPPTDRVPPTPGTSEPGATGESKPLRDGRPAHERSAAGQVGGIWDRTS